jgi:hypothetical protein
MNEGPPCPARGAWERLASGRVPEEEATPLENHLLACPTCLEVVDSLPATDWFAGSLGPPAAGAVPVADDDTANLVARLKALAVPHAGRGSAADEAGAPPDLAAMLAPPEQSGELGRLGGYRVLRLLGHGGMGLVFEAEDSQLQRRVALKTLQPALAASASARQRFLQEARAAAAVKHDHVVTIYQVGEDRGVPFLAMELLAGETLADRLRRAGKLPAAEVLRIGREIAEGLAAAHEKGLIHRDIKPANVWLEVGRDRVKLLDFGLARALGGSGLTQTGAVLGTPEYMAPEQARGGVVDARADLFSLGCVLYRTATGQPPFRGKDTLAVLSALALDEPRPPRELNPEVPPALSDLVMALLAKRPEDRPPSAQAVSAALAMIPAGPANAPVVPPTPPSPAPDGGATPGVPLPVQGPAAPAGPSPAVTDQREGVGRFPSGLPRRWLWSGVAAAVLLTVGVVAWLVAGGGKRPPDTGRATTDLPAPVAYRGSVDLLVGRLDFDGAEIPVPLHDPRAMPLRPGDLFKITAEIDPPAYLYLIWIDEKGQAVPVYPWVPGKWGTRPAEEMPLPRLEIKAPNGNYLKVTGDAAAMETVLMLARPTPLQASDAEVQGWFAGLGPLPLRGAKARVWFEDFDLVRNDPTRGFSYDDDLQKPTSPLGLQGVLRGRIGSAAAYSRAISFARLGKKEPLPALGASTVGLLGSPSGQGPLLAATALFPGRSKEDK